MAYITLAFFTGFLIAALIVHWRDRKAKTVAAWKTEMTLYNSYNQMAREIVGHLDCVSHHTNRLLKREYRRFNMNTGEWT